MNFQMMRVISSPSISTTGFFTTIFDAEIETDQLDIEIGQDQLVPDQIPDHPRHLIPVELCDGVFDLNLVQYGVSGEKSISAGARKIGQAPVADRRPL
jgi:hypothetical protein